MLFLQRYIKTLTFIIVCVFSSGTLSAAELSPVLVESNPLATEPNSALAKPNFVATKSKPVTTKSNVVAVFYPKVKGSYKTVYEEILKGIQTAQSSVENIEVVEFILAKEFVVSDIVKQLRKKGIKQVIVLGSLGYKLAKALPKDEFQAISGGLPIRPGQMCGVSYISDPAKLFEYLQLVNPGVKRIHVAYSERNRWLIKLAEAAAANKGLKLIATKAANTKEAVDYYKSLFKSGLDKIDAIWLLVDKVCSHDKYILPMVLESSWEKEIAVFSSKPSHAKRGTLFSIYPDNQGLGKMLVELVQEVIIKPKKSNNVVMLDELLLAVNVRTASHLGIKYTAEQQALFKLTFPE